MKISEKLINEMQHIKVNKKQDSINDSSYPIIRGKKLYPSQYQTRNSPNDLIFTEMKNNNNSNNNYYFFQNGINNNYLTVENYPLDTDPKDIKYHRINNKRFNKNENKMNYSSITNNKYKKKFVDDEKGKKLYIYKSETQYPLRKKKESIGENDNKSMKIINYNIDKKTMNLKQFNIANKYNSNEKTGFNNKKYLLNDNDNNILIQNNDNNNIKENYSNLTFNKLRHNFYKPLNKKMNNKNINSKSFTNHENNTNDSANQENINLISNKFNNNKYENIIHNKENNNFNKTSNIDLKERKLINIYKNKLVQIFVKLMSNFYINYLKNIYNYLINQLRKNEYNNINNKKYKSKKIKEINKIVENKFNDDKPNFYYIKKNNINFPEDNNKYILAKSLSSNKNYSSIAKYKKEIQNRNIEYKNDIGNEYIANNTNNTNDTGILTKINSSKNIYIPAKNRNMNYNCLSRQKESIFNELKINKSTRLLEMNSNIYQNQNINTQINNFYNTNNSNFYINKINSFNSLMTIEKQKPKIFLTKNNEQNINSQNEENYETTKNPKNNIKCAIFKNKKKLNDVIYKKILSKEKYKAINEQDTKINLFMKRMERVYNKNKPNINEFDNVNQNQTYSIKEINTNNDMKNNQFSTYGNYTVNDKNENNINNIDISNDLNNYNLEDIDKPLNMIQIKNENEEESQNNEDQEIKNIIQMITSDKRLFLNFNYKSINNNYNRKAYNRRRRFLFKSKEISIYIKGKNKYNEEDQNNISNISNNISIKETPEKIGKNLNKFMRKRKIKSGILKLDNFMNDKIYEYKRIFFDYLKGIKFKFIINQILANRSIDILKKYFDIFKNNSKKKENENKINYKSKILNKKNINIMIDDNNMEDINLLQNKEKLKFLVKQINKNNDYEKGNNISFEEDEQFYNNNSYKMPLWQSVQDINLISKISEGNANPKNLYLKKKVIINNESRKFKPKKNIIDKKVNNFRLNLIKYIFYKK